MRDAWRHFAAEFIGVFALVFIGGATIMSSTMANINPMVPAALAQRWCTNAMPKVQHEPAGSEDYSDGSKGAELPSL